MSNTSASKNKLLTFYLNGTLFGLDIIIVKEINRNIEFTPIPDAPPQIIGLMNMRGQVVTLFDLALLLGYEKGYKHTNKHICLILKNSPTHLDYTGFLVDHAGSVIDINEDNWEAPPANISQIDNKLITKVVKLDG